MIYIIILGILAACTADILSARELRVSAASYLPEPHVLYQGGELRGGMIKDIFDQLGRELSIPIRYMDVPRKRVELALASGDLHIVPVSRPQWMMQPTAVDWTEVVYDMREVLVLLAGNPLPYRGIGDLKGLRIGTMLGYQYPVLEPQFRSGAMVRSDVQRSEQNLDMLLNRRVDAYVVHDIEFMYFQKKDARAKLVRTVPLETPAPGILWAVSRKSTLPLDKVNGFVKELKKSGRLEAIMKRYRAAESRPSGGETPSP